MKAHDIVPLILFAVLGIAVIGAIVFPILNDSWAYEVAKAEDINNMEWIDSGKIIELVDCYGYATRFLGQTNLSRIRRVLITNEGKVIDYQYLRKDATYSLYLIKSPIPTYFIRCENQ